MSFETKSLFPTNVYEFRNENAEADNVIWCKAIHDLRNRDSGRIVSNHKGWQSSVPLQLVPQLGGLARFILGCLDEVGTAEGWALDRFHIIIEGWANINGKGALNNSHNHPNCLLSGCYYIDTQSASGNIVFRDPREMAYVFQPPYSAGAKAPVFSITPQPGMLLIFPAWMVHAVEENQSDSDRVSVAFNANVEPRRR